MNKAVTVLHCDRFCIIIANCPSPHTTHFKIRTILRLTLNLPPLSKGGGLTARHKLLLYCVLFAIYLPFLCYKLFCRQDGGIVTPPLAPHQPYQHRTIPCHALYSWLPCQRELDCDKATSYYKLQHFAILSTLIFTQPYLSQD